MTTREELIDGYRMIIREGQRVTSSFSADDWAKQVHGEDGWNRRQVYCHLAATAEITPGFLGNLAKAEEGADAGAGLDINALNAQLVAAKENLSPEELMKAFTAGWEALIEFTKSMTEEQLAMKRRFGEVEGSVGDLLDSVIVLHGIAHIYSAGASAG